MTSEQAKAIREELSIAGHALGMALKTNHDAMIPLIQNAIDSVIKVENQLDRIPLSITPE